MAAQVKVLRGTVLQDYGSYLVCRVRHWNPNSSASEDARFHRWMFDWMVKQGDAFKIEIDQFRDTYLTPLNVPSFPPDLDQRVARILSKY